MREASGFRSNFRLLFSLILHSLFVQERYHQIKQKFELSHHKDVMLKLSQVYKETKDSQLEPRNLLDALADCNQRSSSQEDDDESDEEVSDSSRSFHHRRDL